MRNTTITSLLIVAVTVAGLLQFHHLVAEAACASTYSNGTCVSCTSPTTEYGPYCLTCPCLRGTCNGGILGNGLCTSCSALAYGPYCNRNYPLQAANLLDWAQLGLCFGMFTMTVAILWAYVRVAVYRAPPIVVKPKTTEAPDDDHSLPKLTSARSVEGEEEDDEKSDPAIQFHQATADLMGHEPTNRVELPTRPTTKPVPRALGQSTLNSYGDLSSRLFQDPSRSRSPFDFGEQQSVDESTTLDERQSRGAFSAYTSAPTRSVPSTAPAASVGDPSVSRGRGPRRTTADPGPAGDTVSPTDRTKSPSLHHNERLSPSQVPLPRFHPGDRICRNGKREAVTCDFGGIVGSVLCGESLVVSSVTYSAGHRGYQFAVDGGDRVPSVSDVEELFDLVTSSSDDDDSEEDEMDLNSDDNTR